MSETELRAITWDEVSKHCEKDSLWMVYKGKVYDVTKFLEEHPGGEEVITEQAGLDATQAFDEIGHSEDAHDFLKTLLIGKLEDKPKEVKTPDAPKPSASPADKKPSQGKSYSVAGIMYVLVPILAVVAYFYLKK